MSIELSCADYTWPSLPHTVALDLIAALGFAAVDIGYFTGRSHIRPDVVCADLPAWAGRLQERCAARGLVVADLFFQAASLEDRAVNHPDPAERERSLDSFRMSLEFAKRIGSPGLTIVPGIIFPDDDWDLAVRRAADGLRRRLDVAGENGIDLSIEPHFGSVVDSVDRTLALLDLVPGLRLTLDYSHFIFAGAENEDIDPLLPYARIVQCRGAAKNLLQTDMGSNTIDYPRIIGLLCSQGYSGNIACEYVWSTWQGCNRVDNISETVALKRILDESLTMNQANHNAAT